MNAISWLCTNIAQIIFLILGATQFGLRGFSLVLSAIIAKSISAHCIANIKNQQRR